MQSNDLVSGWLTGAETVMGFDNPAGPLYLEGENAVEDAARAPITHSTSISTCPTGRCYCCM
ncbi:MULTISPECIES: DUF6229 family protein [Lysobacter]|uniref:Uncharacterized protein n=2 Tax=Lysobacter TaxID=68 RepID=A0A0S2DGV8_LYSEN|nr:MULTISPECIES: DUF6229 family protein [Lysobacter]ALN57786.1 hypothetical protein GLE_2437 [Lysobacter enzymogenes]QCW26310.1 hypothetical protein FE772_12180 [Lysobacter enzymogenes]QQP99098.1 hypothetical protein JHW41_13210 [Lysobacter enzymogenes]UZW58541.1 DUF6229 family protein [Lysobacter enzymogenes]WMT02253.1 DUF6229 family protein [Lysobacter yananisis]